VKCTVTAELFQTFAFAAGERVALIVGAVLSRRYEAEVVPVTAPLQFLFFNAVMLTVCVPLPLPAVHVGAPLNVHVADAVAELWVSVTAPVTSTQFVSDVVLTVSTRAVPLFANCTLKLAVAPAAAAGDARPRTGTSSAPMNTTHSARERRRV
jgi:hypothetical protein